MRVTCGLLFFFLALVAGSEDGSSYQKCTCQGNSACHCLNRELCGEEGTIQTISASNARMNSTSYECPEGETCCKSLKPNKEANFASAPVKRDLSYKCGESSLTTRVLRGEKDTEPGQFPWTLAIFKEEGGTRKFLCGASLIDKNLALTAAHCVDEFKNNVGNLKVLAGVWDMKDEDFEVSKVKAIVQHPEYSRSPPENDIAIVVLERLFQPGQMVNTICIPKEGMAFPTGTRCIATGWGKDNLGQNNTMNTEMKQVEVPLVSHTVCEKSLRRTYLGRFFRLHKSFTCAGGEKLDTCKGDGGGPLVCFNGDYYFQVGIVSWGIGCGVRRLPGVYTDVLQFREWINEMQERYS